jgi:hypothetical protein
VGHQFLAATGGLLFQSPSQCWRATITAGYTLSNQLAANQSGFSFGFDMSLNLTGTGFGGITEAANNVQSTGGTAGNSVFQH